MLFQEYAPSLELVPYIHRYTRIRVEEDISPERVVPDGFVKLFFFLDETRLLYTRDNGAMPHWKDGFGGHPLEGDLTMRVSGGINMMMCTFYPSGAFHLFQTPIHLLNNDVIDPECILGPAARPLKDQLVEAADTTIQIRILNEFFTKLLHSRRDVRAGFIGIAESALLAHSGDLSIYRLAASLPISLRTLERGFREQVGMSPKHYARVLRINAVFRKKRENPATSGAAIAYSCGYTDQAHFIREFRNFVGVPPSEYFKEEDKINQQYLGRLNQ